MKQKKQLLRGVLTLLILSLLKNKPGYGYALEMEINDIIGDKLPKGTVYVILKYLAKKGYIRAETRGNGRKVNVYTVTESGMQLMNDHIDLLKKMDAVINIVIKNIEKTKQ